MDNQNCDLRRQLRYSHARKRTIPLRTIEIRTRKTSLANTAIIAETAVIPVVIEKTGMVRLPVERKNTEINARKSSCGSCKNGGQN